MHFSDFVVYLIHNFCHQHVSAAIAAIFRMMLLLQEYRHANVGSCFLIIKPTRCTNFPDLLRHENLHVSGSSSAHHQEFIHCTLDTGVCHTGLKRDFEQDMDGNKFLN